MRMMTADARYSAYFLYSYKGTNTDAVCTSKKRRKRLGLLLVEQAEALPSFLLIFFFLNKKALRLGTPRSACTPFKSLYWVQKYKCRRTCSKALRIVLRIPRVQRDLLQK